MIGLDSYPTWFTLTPPKSVLEFPKAVFFFTFLRDPCAIYMFVKKLIINIISIINSIKL